MKHILRRFFYVMIIALSMAPCSYAQNSTLLREMTIFFKTDPTDFKVIDTAKHEIIYALRYLSNAGTSSERIVQDSCVLQIGHRVSKTYSKTLYDLDVLRHTRTRANYPSPPPVPPIEIFKGYPSKAYCSETRIPFGSFDTPIYKYSEPQPVFDWKIGQEKKTIMGLECTKATLRFRGRDYEAWFAPSVALQEGPWKFRGLPGLIMAIKDTKEHYVFECVNIRQVKKLELIKEYNRNYKELSRQQIRVFFEDIYAHPQQWTKSQGITIQAKEGEYFVCIFNPIELE